MPLKTLLTRTFGQAIVPAIRVRGGLPFDLAPELAERPHEASRETNSFGRSGPASLARASHGNRSRGIVAGRVRRLSQRVE